MKSTFKLFALILCIIFPALSLTVFVSRVDAQKKPPPPVKTIPDSAKKGTGEEALLNQSKLRILDLKEYTILGVERLRGLPSQRKAIEMADITSREKISAVEGRSERTVPGAGGDKIDRSIDLPIAQLINEAYAAFGKYSDINAGIKLHREYENDEFFGDFDFHRNGGHITNANYYNAKGTVSNIHEFDDRTRSKSDLLFELNEYRFYGSRNAPAIKRTGYNLELSTVTDFLQWDPVNMRVEAGGRYVNPDDSRIFNWDLWSRMNLSSVFYSTFINAVFEINTDRIKDGAHGNAPISDANYAKALFTVERLITPRLHVRIGGAYYYAASENANSIYSLDNNVLSVSDRVLRTRKNSIIYPQAAVTYDMDVRGRLFIEYEPKIDSFNLRGKLQINPYFDLISPFSYENTSQSVKVGWRRSYAYDLAFEFYYNDRRVKNYGIIVDNGLSLSPESGGLWSYAYDNILDVNEYRGIVNWSPNPRFNAWGSISFIDYTINKSDFAEHVSYLPSFTFDLSLHYMPGYGLQFIVDGQYIGKRFAAPFDVAIGRNELSDYFLANVTISKQWDRRLGSYLYMSNIFNEKYEIWHNYLAPDLTGGAGLRYFW